MDVAFQPIQGELIGVSVGKDKNGRGYLDYEVRITNQGDADAYVGKLAVNALFQLVTGGSTGTTVQCNYQCVTTRSANPNPGPTPSADNLIRVPAGGSVTVHYRVYPPGCTIGYGTVKVRAVYCNPFPGTVYPMAVDQYDLTTGTVQEDPVAGRVQGQTDEVSVPAGLFSPPSGGGSTGPKPCPDQGNPNIAKPKASIEFDGVQLVGTGNGLQYQTRPGTAVGVSLVLENPWTQGQLGVTRGTAVYDVVVRDEGDRVVKEWKGSTEVNVFAVGTSTKTVKLGSFVAKSGKYTVTASVVFKFSDACQKGYSGTVVVHVVQPSGGGGQEAKPLEFVGAPSASIIGCSINLNVTVKNNDAKPHTAVIKVSVDADDVLDPRLKDLSSSALHLGDGKLAFTVPAKATVTKQITVPLHASKKLLDYMPVPVIATLNLYHKELAYTYGPNYPPEEVNKWDSTTVARPAGRYDLSPCVGMSAGPSPQPSPSPSPQPAPSPEAPTHTTGALGLLGLLGLLYALRHRRG